MTWVLVYLGSSSLCLARHDWEFSIGSLSLTNLGILELLIHSLKVRGSWLMREMQSRAVMESTAVLLGVLITCYAGLALAQGKVLGTKPRGVFAPAIRLPSPLTGTRGSSCIFWAVPVCPEQVAECGCCAVAAPRLGWVGSAEIALFSLSLHCCASSCCCDPRAGLGFLDTAGRGRTLQLSKGIATLSEQEGCGLLVYPS